MVAATADKTRPPIVRLRGVFVGVPGILGFSNLIEPDTAFGESKFKANTHHTEDQLAALAEKIDIHVVAPLWEKFLEEAEEKKFKGPKGGLLKPQASDWLEDHLKDPQERSKIQLPFIMWGVDSSYTSKGEVHERVMRAVSAHDEPLELKGLRLGMESIVQPLLTAGMWASALSKNQAALSFKLQGVRVLQLKQFGGGGSAAEEVTEADLKLLGENFEVEDLAAYAKPKDTKKASEEPRQVHDDLDDEESPF